MLSQASEAEYPMEPFKWGLSKSKFDVSSIFVTGDM